MRTPGTRRLLLSATTVLLFNTSVDAAPAPHADTDARTGKAVVEFLQSEMRERHIPGLQIVVVKNRKVVLSKAFGVASLQYGVAVTDASVFSINSATKSFTDAVGMPNTSFGDSRDVIKNKANSYHLAGDGTTLKNVIEDFTPNMRTGAGINSSAQKLGNTTVQVYDRCTAALHAATHIVFKVNHEIISICSKLQPSIHQQEISDIRGWFAGRC